MIVSPFSARSFFRNPVDYVRRHANGNSAIRLGAGQARFILLRDPDEAWRVLVTDGASFRPGKWKRRMRRFVGETLNTLDGEAHRTRRLLLQPSVERRRVAGFGGVIADRIDRVDESWRDGDRIALRDELERLSLTIAGDVLLSTDLQDEAAPLAAALAQVMERAPRLTPPLHGTAAGRALTRVEQRVDTLLAARCRSVGPGDDLAGVLLGAGLPDRIVRGEVIAFLLAAVDEPPSALVAAWYLLGRNPAVERRFHAELDATLGDRVADPEEAFHLPYLGAVVREALRLFPPARHIDRCPVDHGLLAGARVRPGANVLVSPAVLHREPNSFGRPDEFDPERWLGHAPPPARGAYLPFGAGVHACIGEPLARAIITLSLASIGRRWRLHVDPETKAPVGRAERLVVMLERR